MSTAQLLEHRIGQSPSTVARLGGALWLTSIVTSMFSFFADSQVIVRGDAAATAAAILGNEPLFRAGFTADVLSGLSYLGVTVALYHLLTPVGRSLSLAAALFGAAGIAMGGVALLAHVAPIVLLNGDSYLGAFTGAQLQAAALLALKLRAPVFTIAMLFFGVQIFLVGRLIAQSRILPRMFARLLTVAGPAYVVGALATLQSPPLGTVVMPITMAFSLVAEGSLTVWLLVRGIDVNQWSALRSADGGSR